MGEAGDESPDESPWAAISAVTIQDTRHSPPTATAIVDDSSASETESSTSESEPDEAWKAWREPQGAAALVSDDLESSALSMNDLFPGTEVVDAGDDDMPLPTVEEAQQQVQLILNRRERIRQLSAKYASNNDARSAIREPELTATLQQSLQEPITESEATGVVKGACQSAASLGASPAQISADSEPKPGIAPAGSMSTARGQTSETCGAEKEDLFQHTWHDLEHIPTGDAALPEDVSCKVDTDELDSRAATYTLEKPQLLHTVVSSSAGKVLEDSRDKADRPESKTSDVCRSPLPVFGPPARPSKTDMMDALGKLRNTLGQFKANGGATLDSSKDASGHALDASRSGTAQKGATAPESVSSASPVSASDPNQAPAAAAAAAAEGVGATHGATPEVELGPESTSDRARVESKQSEEGPRPQSSAVDRILSRLTRDGVLDGLDAEGSQPVNMSKLRAAMTNEPARREELWQQFLACDDAPVGGDFLPSPEDFYKAK
eukprot:gb/GFBE01035660.1/.p1 GENE.gb/GFBE01035660.1/~~gb/GFBE01035660.1/.p1  ORF type:complete len:495 (+),score=85.20 gb/GFBE01035660.1/:1-1485(+)